MLDTLSPPGVPMSPDGAGGNGTAVALEVEHLSYEVDGARLIEDVALRVRRGELLGLVGPNGAGKSTLLRAVSGLVPAQGQVWLDSTQLAELDARGIARILARVPQSTAPDGGFSVEELVLTGRTPHLGRFQWETPVDRAIARQAMTATHTRRFEDRLVAGLSGGERQRVMLARALAQQPSVLLLDEPTANLDLAHQVRVFDLVRTLVQAGLAAVAAIHDLELASRYCDRLLLLHGGRVLAEGPPSEVLTPAYLQAAFGVQALVEPNRHGAGLRVTVLAADADVD